VCSWSTARHEGRVAQHLGAWMAFLNGNAVRCSDGGLRRAVRLGPTTCARCDNRRPRPRGRRAGLPRITPSSGSGTLLLLEVDDGGKYLPAQRHDGENAGRKLELREFLKHDGRRRTSHVSDAKLTPSPPSTFIAAAIGVLHPLVPETSITNSQPGGWSPVFGERLHYV